MGSSEAERAVAFFAQGYNCSQAVLVAFAPGQGIEEDKARMLARAFGGGVARQGGTCGALNGALMALGLAGEGVGDEETAKEEVYAKAREFTRRFQSRCGSVRCKTLLGGVDIGTPDGYREAKSRHLFETACPDFVRHAAEILGEMLPPSGR